jgi:hypothetical protein
MANAIAISMDGRGAWRDNVLVERLWRSVKYEEVYLRPTPVSVRRGPRWVGTSSFTIAGVHTRAWMHGRRREPASISCRSARQHDFRRHCRGITPVGLRPTLRDTPTMAHYDANRQGLYLSAA